MSLSEVERSIIVQMQLEKSDKFMSDAVKVAEMGMWDLVANQLPYRHARSSLGISLLIF